jgi:hypothetical protein
MGKRALWRVSQYRQAVLANSRKHKGRTEKKLNVSLPKDFQNPASPYKSNPAYSPVAYATGFFLEKMKEREKEEKRKRKRRKKRREKKRKRRKKEEKKKKKEEKRREKEEKMKRK